MLPFAAHISSERANEKTSKAGLSVTMSRGESFFLFYIFYMTLAKKKIKKLHDTNTKKQKLQCVIFLVYSKVLRFSQEVRFSSGRRTISLANGTFA